MHFRYPARVAFFGHRKEMQGEVWKLAAIMGGTEVQLVPDSLNI